MTKDRPCHKQEVSSLIQDILKVTYDSLQSLPKNTMIVFYYKKNIIRDRIGISVRDGTIHEMRKRSEIEKWNKNRRDDRNSISIYRLIYIDQIIDDNLSIYLMTTSFCGRYDKDVHDIERQYCSPTECRRQK